MDNYQKAFLDLLAYYEGTYGISRNGYDVLFSPGTKLRIIDGWSEDTTIVHGGPKWQIGIPNASGGTSGFSSAAGRYQFIIATWIDNNNKINAPMTKINQDNAALTLVKKILGQNFDFNIKDETQMAEIRLKLKSTWTSLDRKTPKDLFISYRQAYLKYQK